MLKSNIQAVQTDSIRSTSYKSDPWVSAESPRRQRRQSWLACLIVSSALICSPVAEAAKPVPKVAKILPVTEGDSVSLDASASSDKDKDTLKFTWTQIGGPTVTLNNAQSAVATFTSPSIPGTAANVKPISLKFSLEVDDSNANRKLAIAKKTVVVSVKPTKIAPQAKAGVDKTVKNGASVTLSGSQTTGANSYLWTQTAGTNVVLTNANSAIASFTAPKVSVKTTLKFQLSATNRAGSNQDEIIVTVNPDDATALVANAGNDQTVTAGDVVTLSGSQSTGTIQTFAWLQTAGSSVSLQQANTATATFTAPTVSSATVLTFKLTVSNESGPAEDSVSVTVNPASQSSSLKASFGLSVSSIDINDEAEAVISDISGGKKPYRVSFDWGDGRTSENKNLGDDVTHSDTHYYADQGGFIVKATVTDADNVSKQFSASVDVANSEGQCK